MRYYLWGSDCSYTGHIDLPRADPQPENGTRIAPPDPTKIGEYARVAGSWIDAAGYVPVITFHGNPAEKVPPGMEVPPPPEGEANGPIAD